jgi:cytochrome P450
VDIGNYSFKKGFNVEIPVDTLHFCTDFWGEDAAQFRPERFIENPDLEKEFFYLPFGAGPRNCIGMRFAQMQSRLLVARLVKEFQIDLADGFVDDITTKRQMLTFIKPSKDIEVKFTKL